MQKELKHICRHFRMESDHFPSTDNKEYWQGGIPTTKQFWCILTMSTIGPDSGLVSNEECHKKRRCYVEQDD